MGLEEVAGPRMEAMAMEGVAKGGSDGITKA